MMKNRSEIGYLTILGLSLTVVLTVYKENKPLKDGLLDQPPIVKTHLCQSPSGNFLSSVQTSTILGQDGSTFAFTQSKTFHNSPDDVALKGMEHMGAHFFKSWLNESGAIRIQLATFHGQKCIEAFYDHLNTNLFPDGYSQKTTCLSDITPGKSEFIFSWLPNGCKKELPHNSTPARAGPSISYSLV